eukprot:6042651-Prymnesium_polylepis.2
MPHVPPCAPHANAMRACPCAYRMDSVSMAGYHRPPPPPQPPSDTDRSEECAATEVMPEAAKAAGGLCIQAVYMKTATGARFAAKVRLYARVLVL